MPDLRRCLGLGVEEEGAFAAFAAAAASVGACLSAAPFFALHTKH